MTASTFFASLAAPMVSSFSHVHRIAILSLVLVVVSAGCSSGARSEVGSLECDGGYRIRLVDTKHSRGIQYGTHYALHLEVSSKAKGANGKAAKPIKLRMDHSSFKEWYEPKHAAPFVVQRREPYAEGFHLYVDPKKLGAAHHAVDQCLAVNGSLLLKLFKKSKAYRVQLQTVSAKSIVRWHTDMDHRFPEFTANADETIKLTEFGFVYYHHRNKFASVGMAKRNAGALTVTMNASAMAKVGPAAGPAKLENFRDDKGRSLAAYFGVPIDLARKATR